MIRTLSIIISGWFILVAAGCNSKKAVVAEDNTEVLRDTVYVMVEQPAENDSLLLSYETTPCFGRCPVYKIKIFKSGFAIYEGLNFAEKMGSYAYTFSEKEIDEILEMANEVDYRELEDVYDDPRISDLPSTQSEISFGANSKKLKTRANIPPAVKAFHTNLGVYLVEKDWKSYSLR